MANSREGKISRLYEKIPEITQKDIAGYVLDRFDELEQSPSIDEIVKFHSHNKYLLMAHDQERLKILGNIVANHNKSKLSNVLSEYEENLKTALQKTPTTKTHINVLMHIFGFFKNYFNQNQKRTFLVQVSKFRENKITLGQILAKIEPMTYQINAMYLVNQTYFLLYAIPAKNSLEKIPTSFATKKE